jgi:diguanylate cyclase
MGFTFLFVLSGWLLGAIQLVLGVAVGIWLRRPDRAAYRVGKQDMQQAEAIAKRLQRLTSEMATCVDEHRTKLEKASQMLMSDTGRCDESVADMVANVISEIVFSNQKLQAKLDTAEGRLTEQATEIEAHISRSLTDPLTGLPNRREFNERLEERMSAWSRRREAFSLLILDVDHFKKLNDQYGHLAGDQVLASLAGTLRGAIRREDMIARYGGEEFAILLPNTTEQQASLVAQNVREAASRTVVQHGEHAINITVSGGIATIQPNEQVEVLIQRADEALYEAKAAGRNCAFMHDGLGCRLADGSAPSMSNRPAARLVELINAPGSENLPDALLTDTTTCFGSFLPQEAISSTLSETCQELRRVLQQRSQTDLTPSPARTA